jgi:hypothetical protein
LGKEAESITADSWEVLEPTLRVEGSFFLVNYNPDDAAAPTHLMFGDSPRPDALVQHVDYRDNPFLTEPLRLVAEYLRSVDDDAYRHVWLGECRTHSEAQVFRGKFSVEEFTPVRRPQPGDPWSATASKPWDGPYMGADWGFSQDPTTAVKCWIHEKTLYIEHEAYGVGVDIDKTPALFDTIPDARKYLIRADNARPETISYMQQNGYPRVQPCAKWKNCAEYGVTFLRSYEKIIIHPRLLPELIDTDQKHDAALKKLAAAESNLEHVRGAAQEAARRVDLARTRLQSERENSQPPNESSPTRSARICRRRSFSRRSAVTGRSSIPLKCCSVRRLKQRPRRTKQSVRQPFQSRRRRERSPTPGSIT